MKKAILFLFIACIFAILPFRVNGQSCTTKGNGDADCNGKVDLVDYEKWRREFLGLLTTTTADFSTNGTSKPDLVDYEIWRRGFLNIGTTTTPGTATATPTPTTGSTSNYAQNLQKILSSPYRNTANDNSPYLNTPSIDLFNKADLYGTKNDYNGPDDVPHNAQFFTNEGDFRTMCEFSHFAYDDPIVYPNQPGAAHLHMFFGNTYMNAYSGQDANNNDVLNKGGSTCNGDELNRSGYWIPAMIDGKNGDVRLPMKILVYYKQYSGSVGDSVVFPERMRMVIDKDVLHAAHLPTGDQLAFMCNNEWNGARTNIQEFPIPNCPGNGQAMGQGISTLEVNVLIQQCWNGLDPTNYKANLRLLAYPCKYDSTFKIQLPNIQYKIIYPIFAGENTSGWFLASDVDPMTYNLKGATGETNHGDWWSGWNKQVNQEWVDNCNNKVADCAVGWLNATGNRALKVRKQYVGPYKIPGADIYKKLCPINKTISKPADVAYCNTAPMMSTMTH